VAFVVHFTFVTLATRSDFLSNHAVFELESGEESSDFKKLKVFPAFSSFGCFLVLPTRYISPTTHTLISVNIPPPFA